MQALAERLLHYIRGAELLTPGDRVCAAVSGGIDSVALLRLLLELRGELGITLSVLHFNHRLRGVESDADQAFVGRLACEHELDCYCDSGDAAKLAQEEHSGLEAAARELRYGFFRRLLLGAEEESSFSPKERTNGAPSCTPPIRDNASPDKIVTGHTLDDQAETLLMRLIRGTGPRGLGGIHSRILVEDNDGEPQGEIIRPCLGFRRAELEGYLRNIGQPWREDATNSDLKFTRNRIRSVLLPLLQREFNPKVVEQLSELAQIAGDEEEYWENEMSGWLGTVVQWSPPEWARALPGFEDSSSLVQICRRNVHEDNRQAELLARIEKAGHAIANATVSRPWLLSEPKAVQRRVVKAVAEQAGIPLEFKHIEEILRCAAGNGPSGTELSLPRGWRLVRQPEAIVFLTPDLRQAEQERDYEYALQIPGRISVPELNMTLEALQFTPEPGRSEQNAGGLMNPKLLAANLTLRNWQAGDRFFPQHTKSAKKVKELLQEKHISDPQRRLWPVVEGGGEIIWMRGFPVPRKFSWNGDGEAILIREVPWNEQDSL